jgi:isochorismate synthase EntC
VVFARKDFRPENQEVSVIQKAAWLFELLKPSQKGLYLYGFWDSQGGFLGATPEVLFWQRNHHIQTMALAGTLPKSQKDLRRPLNKDPKELLEHHLVVEDIVAQLSSMGAVTTGQLETIELPTLFHLRTQLEVKSRENSIDPLALIELLHPTPALGVSPRRAGYDWLREHPGQERRGIFGGPIMFRLNPQETIALVAIRNIQWDLKGLQVGSGGGVVAGSEFEREWLELAQKREAVFKSLGMWDISPT